MERIYLGKAKIKNKLKTLENTVFIVKIVLAIYSLLSDICM